MLHSIAKFLVNHRTALFYGCVGFTILMAIGLKNLHIETDYKKFFAEDDPELVAYDAIQATYTDPDNVILVVTAKDGNVFSKEYLTSIYKLTEQAWQTPYSLRVDSLTNFQFSSSQDDEISVEDFILDPTVLNDQMLAEKRQQALSEPLLVNLLLSKDASVSAVNISLALPEENNNQAVIDIVEFARGLKDKAIADNPNLEIYVHGTVAMNHAFLESSIKDITSFIPAMFVAIVVLLTVLLRSWWATFMTLTVVNMSTLIAIGAASWMHIDLNNLNSAAPTIIMTLAICDCVHLFANFFNAMLEGKDKEKALIETLEINLQPVFLTSLTTVIGFLCINFSDSPPLAELGTITAVGVVAAFMVTLLCLPYLIMKIPMKIPEKRVGIMNNFTPLYRLVTKNTQAVFWGSVLVAGTCIFFIQKNDLNDNFIKYFGHGTEIRQASEHIQERLTGVDSIAFSLSSHEVDGIHSPDFLRKVDAFVDWCRQQRIVVHVDSYIDVIKRLNQNMHNNDPQWFRIPESRELASQYLLLYETSLPFGLDTNRQVSFDKQSLLVSLRLKVHDVGDMIEFQSQASAWLEKNAPEMATNGSSVSLMFAHLGKNNIESMMKGNFIGILVIVVVMIIALRSIKYGLLSLLPNLVPAGVTLGLWGLFVGEVNMAVSVVFSISLGIVVDDTVHFFSKYLRARRVYGKTPDQAIEYAYSTVGTAMIVTTVVLSIGFFILTLSSFNVSAIMGLLVGVTIIVALIYDLLFLPALLLIADRDRQRFPAPSLEVSG